MRESLAKTWLRAVRFFSMFRRYRQRRGPYAMAAPSVMPSIIRSVILLGIALLLLYFVGKWVLWIFGVGGDMQRNAVLLSVENRSTVNVSLEGGLMQRAEGSIKLYESDRVTTGGNGHALLTFFDGTTGRIDVQSDVTIGESTLGSEESALSINVAAGSLWIRTPDLDTFSGAIIRDISTSRYSAKLPSDAEVVIDQHALIVFSGDGQGVELTVNGADEPVFIGEGQQIQLPDGNLGEDILRFRSAIEPLVAQRTFIEESRGIMIAPTGSGEVAVVSDEDILNVTAPADRTNVTTNTVKVEGTISPRVERVRVNGYEATINRDMQSFTEEISLDADKDTMITIQAQDARGITLAEEIRTVRRGTEEITPPVITSPATAGQTYRTQRTEFEIVGTAPSNAAGIMVNEYKLQLFRAGDSNWSYLASTALNNLKSGTNIYDVYTLDAAGNKSQPVRITILLEAGSEGVVGGGTSGSAASQAATIDETTLPNNAPLLPGSIAVTGPTAGTVHTATGSEFLLEGTAPKAAASVWVNGYRLQLFKAGSGYWNYIAKAEFNTLKPGTNVYTIVVRNDKNEILDSFEYTATYNP